MDVDKLILGITLTVSPFVCVLIALAGMYGRVGMNEICVGVWTVILYWGFLAVATILLKYTEIKEGVRDARQSR